MKDLLKAINEIGEKEGWGLFENIGGSFNGKLCIEKYDEQTRFINDADAVHFVKDLASKGSYIHQMAVSIANN
jgi:hypothetical protein